MTLIAFFSATGKTRALAERISKILGADLYEIEPQEKYTKADLIWVNPFSRSSKEMKNKSSRPAIKDQPLDLSKYDTIYLGFPIWWYVAPTIVNTFLEKFDFSGKKIIPFATSGGSKMGGTNAGLQVSCPNASLLEGDVLNKMTDEQLADWLKTHC